MKTPKTSLHRGEAQRGARHLPRILIWGGALLCVFCALLQWNDPDPLPWIALYVSACVASVIDRGPAGSILPVLVAAAALFWALSMQSQVEGVHLLELIQPMEKPGGRVEVGRELGGLVVLVLWMLIIAADRLDLMGRFQS